MRRGDFAHLVIRKDVVGDVRVDVHDSDAVGTLQVADSRRGHPCQEVADGHGVCRRGNAQPVELTERAGVVGEADPFASECLDDFVTSIIRSDCYRLER